MLSTSISSYHKRNMELQHIIHMSCITIVNDYHNFVDMVLEIYLIKLGVIFSLIR